MFYLVVVIWSILVDSCGFAIFFKGAWLAQGQSIVAYSQCPKRYMCNRWKVPRHNKTLWNASRGHISCHALYFDISAGRHGLMVKTKQPGPLFNIKILSYWYRISHWGDDKVVKSSYLHNGICYSGKMSYLYWINTLLENSRTGTSCP